MLELIGHAKDWNEGDHPRDDVGKFATVGVGTATDTRPDRAGDTLRESGRRIVGSYDRNGVFYPANVDPHPRLRPEDIAFMQKGSKYEPEVTKALGELAGRKDMPERGIVLDSNGQPHMDVIGDQHSVSFDPDKFVEARGGLLMHSHPYDMGPSQQDILVAASGQLKGMMAVHDDHVWLVEPRAREGYPTPSPTFPRAMDLIAPLERAWDDATSYSRTSALKDGLAEDAHSLQRAYDAQKDSHGPVFVSMNQRLTDNFMDRVNAIDGLRAVRVDGIAKAEAKARRSKERAGAVKLDEFMSPFDDPEKARKVNRENVRLIEEAMERRWGKKENPNHDERGRFAREDEQMGTPEGRRRLFGTFPKFPGTGVFKKPVPRCQDCGMTRVVGRCSLCATGKLWEGPGPYDSTTGTSAKENDNHDALGRFAPKDGESAYDARLRREADAMSKMNPAQAAAYRRDTGRMLGPEGTVVFKPMRGWMQQVAPSGRKINSDLLFKTEYAGYVDDKPLTGSSFFRPGDGQFVGFEDNSGKTGMARDMKHDYLSESMGFSNPYQPVEDEGYVRVTVNSTGVFMQGRDADSVRQAIGATIQGGVDRATQVSWDVDAGRPNGGEWVKGESGQATLAEALRQVGKKEHDAPRMRLRGTRELQVAQLDAIGRDAVQALRQRARIRAMITDPEFWTAIREHVTKAATPVFDELYMGGMQAALRIAKHRGISTKAEGPSPLDRKLAERAAIDRSRLVSEWWSTMEKTLVSQLNDIMDKEFEESDGALDVGSVTDAIEGLFGESRAERIAVTETTRIMGQAAQSTYEILGAEEWEWRTAMDNLVCPECEAMKDEGPYPMDDQFEPAHVKCRCWPVPVVPEEESKEWSEDMVHRDEGGRFADSSGGTLDTLSPGIVAARMQAQLEASGAREPGMSYGFTDRPDYNVKWGPPGLSEADQIAHMRDVQQYSRDLLGTTLTPEQLGRLAGAPDGAAIRVETSDGDSRGQAINIRVEDASIGLVQSRYIMAEGSELKIYNNLFKVDQTDPATEGIGIRALMREVAAAEEVGIEKISCHAAGSGYVLAQGDRDAMNGFYTWPRMGFDGPMRQDGDGHYEPKVKDAQEKGILPKDKEFFGPSDVMRATTLRAQTGIDKTVPPEKYLMVSDAMATPEGREWWKANGWGLDVSLDLNNAAQVDRFKAYAAEKGAAGVKAKRDGGGVNLDQTNPGWSQADEDLLDRIDGAKEWNEEDHPRGEGGMFARVEGGPSDARDALHNMMHVPAVGAMNPRGPFRRVETADEALAAIAKGEFVELNPNTFGVALDKMHAMALEAEKLGKDAPKYDLCNVSVEGTLFCAENMGIARIEMPQIADKGAFIDHLHGLQVGHSDVLVEASRLKATQREIDGVKVAGMMAAAKAGKFDLRAERIFISSDNYVLDGHHRWAAMVGLDWTDGMATPLDMPVTRINEPISALLPIANEYVDKSGLARAGFGKALGMLRGTVPVLYRASDCFAEYLAREKEWDEALHPRGEGGMFATVGVPTMTMERPAATERGLLYFPSGSVRLSYDGPPPGHPGALEAAQKAFPYLVPGSPLPTTMPDLPGARTVLDTPEMIAERAQWAKMDAVPLTPEKIAEYVKQQESEDKDIRQDKTAVMVLGLTASAKSTLVADPLALELGARLADADITKGIIGLGEGITRNPETGEPIRQNGADGAAGILQNVSRNVVDEYVANALARGDNVVWPKIGNDYERVTKDLQQLADAGYKTKVFLVEIPAVEGGRRAAVRYYDQRRWVDPDVNINVVDSKPSANYDRLKAEAGGLVTDGFTKIDNSGPIGSHHVVDGESIEAYLARRRVSDDGGAIGGGAKALAGRASGGKADPLLATHPRRRGLGFLSRLFRRDKEWDESLHERDDHGKFAAGGGTTASSRGDGISIGSGGGRAGARLGNAPISSGGMSVTASAIDALRAVPGSGRDRLRVAEGGGLMPLPAGLPGPSAEQALRVEAYITDKAQNLAENIRLPWDSDEPRPTRDQIMANATAAMQEYVATTDLAIRAPSTVLDDIIQDGGFRNQHETGSSLGMYDPDGRAQAESRAFGIDRDADPEDFPIYGYLQPRGDPANDGVVAYDWESRRQETTAEGYGDVRFILHDNVKDDATFTVGDSLAPMNEGRIQPAPVNEPTIFASDDQMRVLVDKEGKPTSPSEITMSTTYWESQIHGGVTLADVKRVEFTRGMTDPSELERHAENIAQLEAKGIDVRVKVLVTDPNTDAMRSVYLPADKVAAALEAERTWQNATWPQRAAIAKLYEPRTD